MNENQNKKNELYKYRSPFEGLSASITGLGGLATTIYGLNSNDLETIVAGGLLFIGGAIWASSIDLGAYIKASFDKTDDVIKEKRKGY